MMRKRMIGLFLLPALVFYIGLVIAPAIQAIVLSFFDTSGFSDARRFVGLGNYAKLLSDEVFWKAGVNTLLIMVVGGVAVFLLAFGYTMMINSGIRWRKLFRAAIFMPNIVAVVAITSFWSFLFMPRYGLLFSLLKHLQLDRLAGIAWTAPENVFWSMLLGLVWLCSGFFMILIMAGADKIPADIYEAARLDGAGHVQTFLHITLPMIWDVLAITYVLWLIQALKTMEFPYAFGGPNIDSNLYTMAIYLYVQGFGQRQPIYALGYATAIGVVMLLVTTAITLACRRLMRHERLEY